MKRWFWILDAMAVMSFALIGSDFHGFTFDLLAIMRVAAPFFVALAGGIAALRLWRNPLAIVNGLALALIASIGGLLLRHYVWGDGTARAFILVTGAYFIAFMVGWRLIALGVEWFANRSSSPGVAA
jgi:hypothetical protein